MSGTRSMPRGVRGKLFARAATVFGLCASTAVFAVTPLSPQLTPASHQELVTKLNEIGMAQVAHNSVLIALTQALGLQAQARTYVEDSRYPHLPSVSAQATPGEANCATVTLHASFAPPRSAAIRLVGTYCPVSLGVWQAKAQDLTAGP
ncbi:MAG: hypothetical protein IPF55_11835 [Rhodoferax sp.]|nr:hypothetical protein [Rhodoferax sp.]